MALLKKALKQPWFKPVMLILILSVFVWFAGPYIAFANYYPLYKTSSRLLLILLFFLVWAVTSFYKYHQSKQQNSKLSDELAADSQLEAEKTAEAVELKEKFEQAFDLLKKNARHNTSITALPWYMIIGSPGCGKTTLLSNSGLEFPLAKSFGKHSVRGVGGTKNCDWWFTEEAVLLDTAGRYTSQESNEEVDKAAWIKFLDLIKKYRKKPINGILVSFSVDELLSASAKSLEAQLSAAKQRISELNTCFQVKLPVYVVLTKTDLVPGFTEFFENYGYGEREQVFGLTLSPQANSMSSTLLEFNASFSQLLSSICHKQWARMEQERDPGRKKTIYLFSHQIAALKNSINQLLRALCNDDGYTNTGLVRGVYLTSGTQYGVPIDRLLENVANSFGLNAKKSLSVNAEPRSYFIKNLLQAVIFKEANEFGVLTAYEKRKKQLLSASYAAGATLSLLLIFAWYLSYNQNNEVIVNTDENVVNWLKSYDGEARISVSIPAGLAPLNQLAKMLSYLGEKKSANVFQLGLGQASPLYDAVNESYRRLLNVIVLPSVKEVLENQLRQRDVDDEFIFQSLKAYLMLARAEYREVAFLSQWMELAWSKELSLNESERKTLAAHFEHLIGDELSTTTLDQDLITLAQRRLNKTKVADLYFYQFKQNYVTNDQLMLGMADIAGPQWHEVFAINFEPNRAISAFYSKEFFETVKNDALDEFLKEYTSYDWVLGKNTEMPDIYRLKSDIMRSYAHDYANAWKHFLSQLRINPFTHIQQAISALESASGTHSAFIYLMNSINFNTRLSKEGLMDKTQKLLKRQFANENRITRLLGQSDAGNSAKDITPEETVTRAFERINALSDEKSKLVYQDKLLNVLSELFVHLSLLSQQTQDGAIGQVKQNVKSIQSLRTFAVRQPPPLKGWLRQISNETENILFYGAKIEIEDVWLQSYLKKCRSVIAQNYPFSLTVSQDVLLQDFTGLFGNRGIVQTFYNKYLNNVIDSVSVPWQWKSEVPAKLIYTDHVLRFFEQAKRIQQAYFDTSGENPYVELEFTPVYLDPDVTQFTLNVSGQVISYQFGPPIGKNIVWPAGKGVDQIIMSFKRKDGSEVVSREEGTFGLFRVLQQSDIKQLKKNLFRVTFNVSGYKAIYELASRRRKHPLDIAPLSKFTCLESFQP